MITLYGPRMGSSLRPHWMLAELGVEYTTKDVDLRKGEHRTPEYLALNPTGQVPTIEVDGFILAESLAITRYLAAKFQPAMNGRTLEEQAKGAQWELWAMLGLQQHLSTIASQKWTGVMNPEGEAKAREILAKHFPILETYLGTTAFLAGDVFTTADLNACVTLSYTGFIGYDLSVFPNIQRWMSACTTRPAYLAVQAKVTA